MKTQHEYPSSSATVPQKLAEQHVSGLRLHAHQPGAHRRIALEVETAVGGAMRIGVERDVGDDRTQININKLSLSEALERS
jgi:hypothetical protein